MLGVALRERPSSMAPALGGLPPVAVRAADSARFDLLREPTDAQAAPRTPCDIELLWTLVVEVQDTGGGIPEHVQRVLFTDDAISTKPGGTGLGTRIVSDVVRRHNGTIAVESEAGKGSTFSIRLPLHHKEK